MILNIIYLGHQWLTITIQKQIFCWKKEKFYVMAGKTNSSVSKTTWMFLITSEVVERVIWSTWKLAYDVDNTVLVRSLKLSNIGRGYYLDGWPIGYTAYCCLLDGNTNPLVWLTCHTSANPHLLHLRHRVA